MTHAWDSSLLVVFHASCSSCEVAVEQLSSNNDNLLYEALWLGECLTPGARSKLDTNLA
jgi:hypothetical protein